MPDKPPAERRGGPRPYPPSPRGPIPGDPPRPRSDVAPWSSAITIAPPARCVAGTHLVKGEDGALRARTADDWSGAIVAIAGEDLVMSHVVIDEHDRAWNAPATDAPDPLADDALATWRPPATRTFPDRLRAAFPDGRFEDVARAIEADGVGLDDRQIERLADAVNAERTPPRRPPPPPPPPPQGAARGGPAPFDDLAAALAQLQRAAVDLVTTKDGWITILAVLALGAIVFGFAYSAGVEARQDAIEAVARPGLRGPAR